MIKIKSIIRDLELTYRDFGSLDMSCDFCDKHSYDKNFHITYNSEIIVICEECLNKVRTSTKEKRT